MARPTRVTDQGSRAEGAGALGRRRFLTYLVAAPTLTIVARWGLDELSPAQANALPPLPGPTPSDFYDIGDALKAATDPTSDLLRLEVEENGRIVLELPRAEVGQGITTAMAMLVAEEMGARLSDVDVVLSDARPELMFNQITGASTSTRTLFTPVRLTPGRSSTTERWSPTARSRTCGRTAPRSGPSSRRRSSRRPLSPRRSACPSRR